MFTMKRVFITLLGVLLTTGTVAALAAKEDGRDLTQCQSSIKALYGNKTYLRLRSIHRGRIEKELRIMTTPESGGNMLVVCKVDTSGSISLSNRDGIALRPRGTADTLTQAR